MTTVWHTGFLDKLNKSLYADVLTSGNIITDEVCKTFNGVEYFGVVLQTENNERKIKEKYFLEIENLALLPIKVTSKTKFNQKSDVFWFIESAKSVRIPAKEAMTFKTLIDTLAQYDHSRPTQWTLFKIIMVAGFLERLNIRIVSEASFGKDAIADILSLLNGDVANLYKATVAKLKYSLRNDFIVINELGALKTEDVGDMQNYLLQVGAFKHRYENSSRSTNGTKETEDLSDKSHVVFHNTPEYYESKKQKYFEKMFTPAVMDRFPALLMEGYVSQDFTEMPTLEDVNPEQIDMIKSVIATINFYKNNDIGDRRFKLEDNLFLLKGKEKQRILRNFKTIAKYVSYYAETQQEFDDWMKMLSECYKNYKEMEQRI